MTRALRASTVFVLASAIAVGCGGPRVLSAPAPDGALACALRQTVQLGYDPMSGGVADGFIRLRRSRGWSGGDVAGETTARLMTLGLMGSTRVETEHLEVVGASGLLRVRTYAVDSDGEVISPTDRTVHDAEGVLAACAAVGAANRVTPRTIRSASNTDAASPEDERRDRTVLPPTEVRPDE